MGHTKNTQEPIDITEHFRTIKHIPETPLTPEQQAVKDALREELNAQFDLAPPIDVPEPVISIADMGHYAAILLNGMGIFYIGTLIGNAIAYLLP
jgi:hypothetical protein